MGDIFEEVAGLAQRYLSEKPTLVLGSGASISLGLPGMSELGHFLLGEVETTNEEENAQWATFKECFLEKEDLELALNEVHISESLLRQVIEKTWKLISDRDFFAYHQIVNSANFHPLSGAFRHFLRVAEPKLDVVTTNYDRLAEYAANAAAAQAFVGFSHGWIQRLSANDVAPARRQVNIWKVHGSLDWFESENRQTIGIPMAKSILPGFRPVIVTPGVTKYRQAHLEPFRTVMAQADRCLECSRVLLCVGYGFNDEHVQPKLVTRIRQYGVPIVIVTRTLTPAARNVLFSDPPQRFLAIEKSNDGSIVYWPARLDGENVPGLNIWALDQFMSLLLEP